MASICGVFIPTELLAEISSHLDMHSFLKWRTSCKDVRVATKDAYLRALNKVPVTLSCVWTDRDVHLSIYIGQVPSHEGRLKHALCKFFAGKELVWHDAATTPSMSGIFIDTCVFSELQYSYLNSMQAWVGTLARHHQTHPGKPLHLYTVVSHRGARPTIDRLSLNDRIPRAVGNKLRLVKVHVHIPDTPLGTLSIVDRHGEIRLGEHASISPAVHGMVFNNGKLYARQLDKKCSLCLMNFTDAAAHGEYHAHSDLDRCMAVPPQLPFKHRVAQ